MSRLWNWFALGEWLLELVALCTLALPPLLDGYYPSPLLQTLVQIAFFLINAVAWLVIAFCFDRGKVGTSSRGSAFVRHHSIYFLLATSLHALVLIGWIVHLAKWYGLEPLNFTTNVNAFFVYRDLVVVDVLEAILLTLFAIYNVRDTEVRARVFAT